MRWRLNKTQTVPLVTVLAIGGLGFLWAIFQEPSVESRDRQNMPHSSMVVDQGGFAIAQDGKEVKLSTFKGRGFLLHFWASWCAPCLKEIPEVLALARKVQDAEFKIVFVSTDERWEDALKVLPVGSLPKNAVSLLDPAQRLATHYASFSYPETFLIDKDLKVVTKWVGAQKWNDPEALRVLRPYF